jgi:hypothetical protein
MVGLPKGTIKINEGFHENLNKGGCKEKFGSCTYESSKSATCLKIMDEGFKESIHK